jgi:hypothetical protein
MPNVDKGCTTHHGPCICHQKGLFIAYTDIVAAKREMDRQGFAAASRLIVAAAEKMEKMGYGK